MGSARIQYLEQTFQNSKPEIRELVVEEVDRSQDGYTFLAKETIEALAQEIGVEPHGRKPVLVNRIREEHPKLDDSRSSKQFSKRELRELYAILAVGETIPETTTSRRSIVNV